MIHHVGVEVRVLEHSALFYDAVFHALGGRRLYESGEAIGWGVDEPVFWITARAAEARIRARRTARERPRGGRRRV